ncbi:MAG: hypothetical protein ACXVGB_00205 [Mycobacteriaceae bacterium]
MSGVLHIAVTVDDDPKFVDPHDIAEDIIYAYTQEREAQGATDDYPMVMFVSAEWEQ